MSIVLEKDLAFDTIKQVRSDEQGRLVLGKEFSSKEFRVAKSADGMILLTPMVSIPERDVWLYQNPAALLAFQEGLAAAARGDVVPPKDYSQFAHLPDEED